MNRLPSTHRRKQARLVFFLIPEAIVMVLSRIKLNMGTVSVALLFIAGITQLLAAKSYQDYSAEIVKEFLDSLSAEGYRLTNSQLRDEYVENTIATEEVKKTKEKTEKKLKKIATVKGDKFQNIAAYMKRKYPKQFDSNKWERLLKGQREPKMEAYFKRYAKLAQEEQRLYGIPASITLVQGALESGCGTSKLATSANNHFGIKGKTSIGCIYLHDDCCRNKRCHNPEAFRKYDSAWHSFRDHSNFLMKPNYASLRVSRDWKDWAAGLERQGYATAKYYAEAIVFYTTLYNLEKYN